MEILIGKSLDRLVLNTIEYKFYYIENSGSKVFCEGVAQVAMYVPKGENLSYVPFLPVKYEGKSYCTLCMACLKEKNKDVCPHRSLKKRAFVDTWLVPFLSNSITEMTYPFDKYLPSSQYFSLLQRISILML